MVGKILRNALATIFLSFCIPTLSISAVIYVDKDATGVNDGSSWFNAFVDFQDGLSEAVSGDEIWVAEGTYKPSQILGGSGDGYKSFQMKNEVGIYGGFTGYETAREQRNFQDNLTILSCDIGIEGDDTDNCYHVFYHGYMHSTNLDNTAILDGFTITGARNYLFGGGGMANWYDSPTIRNCVFTDNQVGRASGMLNENSSPIIKNCSFIGNIALHGSGGGVSNLWSSPVFTNCTFKNNSAIGGLGGGINNSGSHPLIINCRFLNNSALLDQAGGGTGGGIYNDYESHPTIINNVFFGNTADSRGGALHSHEAKSPLTIINNIFWDNDAPTGKDFDYWYYSDVSPPKVIFNNISDAYTGEGNISENPQFVDPASDDFHLQPGSPCIDAGTGENAPSEDFEGNPRPQLARVDIGVDEYTGRTEDFESEPIDFTENSYFSVSGGRLHFGGDTNPGVTGPEGVTWNGGISPGGDFPSTEDSNYLENFIISVDTFWGGRDESDNYGLFSCSTQSVDGRSSVSFNINRLGSYNIYKKIDDVGDSVVGWTKSSLLSPDGQDNRLSIKKVGPYFHFYIDQVEVERRLIEGFHGGGVGVYGSHSLDASFDNFAVAEASYRNIEVDSNTVFEDFNTGLGGFSEGDYFSHSNQRLAFQGDDTGDLYAQAWRGGFDPGGWSPDPEHTNYFGNFTVSTDTFWDGGDVDYAYGLIACLKENSSGHDDSIRFWITQSGYYLIGKVQNDTWQTLVNWTESSLITPDGVSTELTIQKNGDQFDFTIGDTVVQSLTITGFPGGGIGIEASQKINVSFDDFTISQPGTPPDADAGNDQTVTGGSLVSLNGNGSNDDISINSYKWVQLSGPPITLSDQPTAQPTFTAPSVVSKNSLLAFQLLVMDSDRLHSSDICIVQVNCSNVSADVDGNCRVDLADAIIPLQVAAGMSSFDVRTDYLTSGADVNGNNQVGIEEAINALRESSGL